MRILLILSAFVGIIFAALDIPEHMQAPLKKMRTGCLAETGVDEKYVNESKNGNLPDVPELGCYILCLMEHTGVIDEKGVIDFEAIYHLFTPSVKESFIYVKQECGTMRGDTRCQTAYRTIKCFFEKLPEGAELP